MDGRCGEWILDRARNHFKKLKGENMENWYAMRTVPDQEEVAVDLIRRTVDPSLWEACRVLQKQKLFRADGKLILDTERMFPGYIFLKTDRIHEIVEILGRSREYPRLLGNVENQTVRIEEEDLAFLKQVCGEELEQTMGLSEVETDKEGNLVRIKGILKPYSERIVRKRLRKRYVLAEVGLFGRQETVLFGIRLPGDEIWQSKRSINI